MNRLGPPLFSSPNLLINPVRRPSGLIGVGDPTALSSTSGALHAFNIPLISTSPDHAERLDRDDHVLTTAPDMAGQARVRHIKYIRIICQFTLKLKITTNRSHPGMTIIHLGNDA